MLIQKRLSVLRQKSLNYIYIFENPFKSFNENTSHKRALPAKDSTTEKTRDLKLFRIFFFLKKGICCGQAVLFAHLKEVLRHLIAIAVIFRSQEIF